MRSSILIQWFSIVVVGKFFLLISVQKLKGLQISVDVVYNEC